MGQTETKMLPVSLTEEELLAYASKISELIKEKEGKENEKAGYVKQVKAETDLLEAEIFSIAEKISSKSELREVECRYELDGQVKKLLRCDTGEIVRTMPLTQADIQLPLFALKQEFVHG